jgi:hypothetical protein
LQPWSNHNLLRSVALSKYPLNLNLSNVKYSGNESNMAIRRLILWSLLLACFRLLPGFACSLYAQNMIPAGTIIPVELQHSIDSQRNKAGQPIIAQVAQDVPLGEKRSIHRGSKVMGEIVQVENTSGQTTLSLRFDRIVLGHSQLPIATQLRAVADFMSIWDAQQPTNAVDGRWAFSSSWTTVQIGGDVVYHGGGIVQSPTGEVVGTSTPCVECGVLDVVKSAPGPKCAGAVAEHTSAGNVDVFCRCLWRLWFQ